MISERWPQVRAMLEKVLSLNPAERSSYLAEACGSDAGLRGEVESILGSYERAGEGNFLQTPAVNLLQAVADPDAPSRLGRRLGVYLILEEIGHGGMGEVYRAARVDGQYEKEVAVKLVRGGYDTASVLQRFRQERQILASLDHPNIARLLDGGTTEDGVPYLVMELIQGTAIDQYSAEHGLPVRERLGLFLQVCSAVQYAHQRLVIHRDLKPGNILVTTDGTPKLLDFGIAKLLDPSGEAEPTLLAAMTPEYASPEQVRGEPITTSSDVYSLGVVFYKLLTGQSPYRVTTRSSSELARAITDAEPSRPSTVVGSQAKTASNTSEDKESGVRRTAQRQLSGDLDNIALKSLRKEPARRYASVEQFAEDIRRHLDGLPVLATPDSLAYRSRKFVLRNKVGVAAAALVLITIFTGVAVSLREAHIARQQRERAEKRFSDVRQLANSLIFEIHDSIEALPGATPARRLLLDRAVEYLDKLSQDASGDVELQRELAWGYQRLSTVQGDTTQSNLGQVSAAEESHRKAMALFEAVAKANPHNLKDQLNLAMAYRMRAFFDIYVPSGGGEINQALAVTDRLMQTDGDKIEVKEERLQELFILGSIQDAVGDRVAAIDTFRKVLRLKQEVLHLKPDLPGGQRGLAKATVLLAHQMGRFGSRDEALQLMNTGVAEYEALAKTSGEPDVKREWIAAEGRRGDVELMKGDMAAALSDFRNARESIVRLARLDPENTMLQSDLWVAEFEEGRALSVSGKNAEALPLLQDAFRGYMNLHLEDDVGPGPGAMQAWIGEAQFQTHHFAEALEEYQKAAQTLTRDVNSYDDARCDLAMVYAKIGNTLLRMGKTEDASAQYGKALETANLSAALRSMDVPALYAAAEAYAGIADVKAAEARKASAPASRAKLWNEAHSFYTKGLDLWKRIPNPARYGPNGYTARDPNELNRSLMEVRNELAQAR